jgi:membrane protein implicated in regulation of membrane protease activity
MGVGGTCLFEVVGTGGAIYYVALGAVATGLLWQLQRLDTRLDFLPFSLLVVLLTILVLHAFRTAAEPAPTRSPYLPPPHIAVSR